MVGIFHSSLKDPGPTMKMGDKLLAPLLVDGCDRITSNRPSWIYSYTFEISLGFNKKHVKYLAFFRPKKKPVCMTFMQKKELHNWFLITWPFFGGGLIEGLRIDVMGAWKKLGKTKTNLHKHRLVGVNFILTFLDLKRVLFRYSSGTFTPQITYKQIWNQPLPPQKTDVCSHYHSPRSCLT